MQPTKTSAKDFFLHLGAMIALYATAISLVNLLFTVINKAYPQVNTYYSSSYSISFPVSVMIIMFPIFILLMWLLEKSYDVEPGKRDVGIKKWLTYITLFVSGLITAGVLITVVYYFIDGRELTTGFLLKILVTFAVSLAVFMYYITDIRGKLTSTSRKIWAVASAIVIIGAIIAGFLIIGSPRTQQLIRYDEQRVSDLQNIDNEVRSYYQQYGSIPSTLNDVSKLNSYMTLPVDPQTKNSYVYVLVGQSAKAYQLCATFNKDSSAQNTAYPMYVGAPNWNHPAGHYCFNLTIPVSQYPGVNSL